MRQSWPIRACLPVFTHARTAADLWPAPSAQINAACAQIRRTDRELSQPPKKSLDSLIPAASNAPYASKRSWVSPELLAASGYEDRVTRVEES